MAESIPIKIPPGIVNEDSDIAAGGRYLSCDKVRMVKGFPQKWGGWTKFIADQFTGTARGSVSWANVFNVQNFAFGTESKLYALTDDDQLNDITPLRASGTLGTDPFTTTDTSTTVSVEHTTHGVIVGDTVIFSGATAVGGITIDGAYLVVSVTDADNYTITHSAAATSSATGGGAAVDYEYEITIGTAGGATGFGWGASTWGSGTWGTPRAEGIETEQRTWFVQEYGNNLLALPSGGTLYDWDEATDARAQPVTNAPSSARAMFVTHERFPFLLGTTTPMTVQWPDQDDITVWTPSSTNTANSRKLQGGSTLIAGTSLTELLAMVWSDSDAFLFQYTGSAFIYDSRSVGTKCGLIGPLAFTVIDGVAYWMSGHSFHMYGGSVQDVPRFREIANSVFGRVNQSAVAKTWCFFNPRYKEIVWGFAADESTEPNRYVAVALEDYSWTEGTLPRTGMMIFKERVGSIIGFGSDRYIYSHETGKDADGSAMEAFIQYGYYDLGNGGVDLDVMGFIPDIKNQAGELTVDIYTKNRPNSTSFKDSVTLTLAVGEEIEDCRIEGRYFGFTIRSNIMGGDFRCGVPLIELEPGGDDR